MRPLLVSALSLFALWPAAGGADTTAEELQALRWATGADIALYSAPHANEETDEARPLTHFWLTAHDLELLLEIALQNKPPALQMAGARVRWNPLRPPYDRIFEIQLLDAQPGLEEPTAVWRTLVGGDRLVSVVLPLELAVQLTQAAAPWFAAPVVRQRSGLPSSPTAEQLRQGRTPPRSRLLEQWREQGWDKVLASVADSGLSSEVSLRPRAWFGRSSLYGWLTGIVLLLAAALLVQLARRRLAASRR